MVDGNRQEERAERRATLEAANRARQRNERLVHEILRRRGVPDEPSRESMNGRLVPVVHLGHRGRLAVTQALEQRRFFRRPCQN